jgi:hypothetical protein
MPRTTTPEPETTVLRVSALRNRSALLLAMVYDLQDEVLAKPEPDRNLLAEFEHISRSYLLAVSR